MGISRSRNTAGNMFYHARKGSDGFESSPSELLIIYLHFLDFKLLVLFIEH